MEDLQEGREGRAKDGVEQQLVDVDVQHRPAMEVVQEEES